MRGARGRAKYATVLVSTPDCCSTKGKRIGLSHVSFYFIPVLVNLHLGFLITDSPKDTAFLKKFY